jgi:UDP-perosamine 4-acetyltransferase
MAFRSEKIKVVVVGSGGHAKVIIDILQSESKVELVGAISSDRTQSTICDIPVLGDDSILPKLFSQGINHAFIAVGSNRLRAKLGKNVEEIGFQLINAISPQAVLSARVKLGKGIAIMPGAVVNVDTQIDDYAIINTGATVDHDCRIGRYVHIAPGSHLCGNVEVGEGTFICVGSSVIDKSKIGEWAVLGAGGVVISDLPAYVTAVGVPARVIKNYESSKGAK